MTDKIYTVVRSSSYGDFGESYNIAYHKTEEGAYLRLDEEAKKEGFTEKMVHQSWGGGYFYDDGDGRSMHVREIKLEE